MQALLPTGLASDALLIPQQAVNRDLTGRANVLVVNADDVVEKRPVELAAPWAAAGCWTAAWSPASAWWWTAFNASSPATRSAPNRWKTSKGEPARPRPPRTACAPGQGVNCHAAGRRPR
jgi:membrane fusion protein (multidrug efflux system)